MFIISYSAHRVVKVPLITLFACAASVITLKHTEQRRRSTGSFSKGIRSGKNMANRILIERRMKMTGKEKYRFLCRMIKKIPEMRNINATDHKTYSGFELGFLSFYNNVIAVIEAIDNEGSINGD